MILFLQILGGLAAVALGIFLGSSSFTQSQHEIEARLGVGKPRRRKSHFMWLDFIKAKERGSDRRRTREHFKTAVARTKDDRPEVGRKERPPRS